jgi:hypothetical protein
MPSDFETTWTDIGRALDRGTVVQNWGAARGYTGGTFKIVDVDRTSITVSGGEMSMPRRVSKGDFEKVASIWEEYTAGNYPRSKMTNLSQNTTYILSILHVVTDAQGRAS